MYRMERAFELKAAVRRIGGALDVEEGGRVEPSHGAGQAAAAAEG
jgi:hypothetical protein